MSDVESFIRFCESDFGTAVMDREATYLRQFVTHDDRILDVGAGIGSIEARFPDHDIVGLDMAIEMAHTARSRVDAPFIVGDARNLPIGDELADAVFFVSTLEFVPEIEAVLEEAIRVLRPDGTLVTLILNTASEYVQANLERDGSYFQRMVHRDTAKLAGTIETYVDGHREYILGIDEQDMFETSDPTEAAILAVSGPPAK